MKNIVGIGVLAALLSSCDINTQKSEKDPVNTSKLSILDSLKNIINGFPEKNDLKKDQSAYSDYEYLLKIPTIDYVSEKDYQSQNKIIDKSDFLKNIKSKIKKNKTKLVLEGSFEHEMFRDSTMLFTVFDGKQKGEHINNQYESLTNQKKIYDGVPKGVTIDKEFRNKLHQDCIDYIDGKYEGESTVREDNIHIEKYGSITLYYTDLNKELPGMIAKHDKIKPSDDAIISHIIDGKYAYSDYYNSTYKKPVQSVTTISAEILKKYGIMSKKDIERFLNKANSYTKIQSNKEKQKTLKNIEESKSEPSVVQTPEIPKQVEQPKETFSQTYEIKTNGSYELTIRDFDTFDFDKIKVNQPDFPDGIIIDKKPAILDIRKLQNGELIVEIMYEGHKPPCTFAFKIGNHEQQINGKKGDKILLKFQ